MSLNAASDAITGLGRGAFWAQTAVWDIRRRYASSVLGPLWISAGLLATSFAIGFIYNRLFAYGEGFLVYVTAGFMVWHLITGILGESMSAFQAGSGAILFSSGPLSIHVYRVVVRELIIMAHNMIVFLGVAVLVGNLAVAQWHWAFLGLLILVVVLTGFGLALACLATLYDDFRPIVSFILTLMMFVTPLFWMPGAARGLRSTVVEYNPFYHLVSIIREPLLGHAPSASNWTVSCCVAVLGIVVGLVTLQLTRKKIPLQL